MTDAEKFKEMFLPLGRMMFAEAVRILGDAAAAEDAVQDVYTSLWERRGEIAAVGNRRAYVMAMVRNRCLTLSAGATVRQTRPAEAESDSLAALPDDIDSRDRAGKVIELIGALPAGQRTVIMMHDVEGYSKEEIERSTGLSPDNVRQLLSRARRFIRSHFSND